MLSRMAFADGRFQFGNRFLKSASMGSSRELGRPMLGCREDFPSCIHREARKRTPGPRSRRPQMIFRRCWGGFRRGPKLIIRRIAEHNRPQMKRRLAPRSAGRQRIRWKGCAKSRTKKLCVPPCPGVRRPQVPLSIRLRRCRGKPQSQCRPNNDRCPLKLLRYRKNRHAPQRSKPFQPISDRRSRKASQLVCPRRLRPHMHSCPRRVLPFFQYDSQPQSGSR
jgi:hypothetical protein